ncbi:MAG: DUF5678 domain-containing protein [Planctomycetia bacterium]|nr:DUF5678 domain-containing protein [Planctomycetia bacterium]
MIRRVPDSPKLPPIDVSAYRGKWIAIDSKTHKVLGHGDSPASATKKLALKNIEPLLYFVSSSDAYFVGSGA